MFPAPTRHVGDQYDGGMTGLRDQFRQPHGRLGRLAGQVMAAANAGMNRFTVELLDVQPDDRILEIGFGPGDLI